MWEDIQGLSSSLSLYLPCLMLTKVNLKPEQEADSMHAERMSRQRMAQDRSREKNGKTWKILEVGEIKHYSNIPGTVY